jgi:hypothetical protein
MNRRAMVATVTALAAGAAGFVPASAGSTSVVGKTVKGTWSYTDVTVDPSPSAMGAAPKLPPRDGYCVGAAPSAPSDVNVHTIKVKGAGYLRVSGTTTGDWAMEIRDSRNHVLAGSDGDVPQAQEGTATLLRKAGTYKVVYCNLGGAPDATAKYSFRYR